MHIVTRLELPASGTECVQNVYCIFPCLGDLIFFVLFVQPPHLL